MSDVEQLVLLFDGYRQFYGKPSDPERARAFLTERMERGEAVVFLSEMRFPVGFTLLYPLFSSVRMAPVWLLNDLFVTPDCRRKGVGEALLRQAEHFARDEGAAGLELATERSNSQAKSVYERLGWSLESAFDHYSLDLSKP